jgi:hypothetical protein
MLRLRWEGQTMWRNHGEQENGRRRCGRLRRRAEEVEENEWIERFVDEVMERMDSNGGGESNDSNDDEQMEGDEENDNSIDEDNDESGSEDDDNDGSEDDDNDVSDDESVDMNEIDEQLNSD